VLVKNGSIYLSVMSDDYGMCGAINDGTVRGFTEGLVTDASLIAIAPGFIEAARLAKTHGIPVGLHVAFTCEWHRIRWKSLTRCASMTGEDGYLLPTVRLAWAAASAAEVEIELSAQWERLESEGLVLTHVGEHMGADEDIWVPIVRRWVHRNKVPHRGYVVRAADHDIPHLRLTSMFETSGQSTKMEVVRERLRAWLFSLRPGHHLWLCHCAEDHPSLLDMAGPGQPTHWANTFRTIDMALVTDPEVRGWIEQLGIRRVPVSKVPVAGF
jgi:predicted glycoside hydrolase/deacetylase ChbG (UPF0249 family)